MASMGLLRSIVAILVSTLFAAYTVPLMSWTFGVPGHLAIGLAFVLGLFAQTIIGAAFGALPEFVKGLLDALVERVRGK
jgi:hypothetical protein